MSTPLEKTLAEAIVRGDYRPTPPTIGKPFVLYWGCSEWVDGPQWARMEVTQAFVDEVHRLHAHCLGHHVSVSKNLLLAEWENSAEYRPGGDELHVSASFLWLSTRPKHADYDVETHLIGIKEFFDAIEGKSTRDLAWAGEVLVKDSFLAKELARGLKDKAELDVDEACIENMPA